MVAKTNYHKRGTKMKDSSLKLKELKTEYNNEKRAAKADYKRRVEMANGAYKKALFEYNGDNGKSKPIDPPKRSILEEIGNSITHGLGSIFAIVALVLMLLESDNFPERLSALIYFFGMFIMFTSSCLYHAFAHGSAVKRLFRRFDYSSIYLLIGATFAPVLICFFGDTFGMVFFIIQWAIIAAGISFVGVFGPTRLRFLHIPLYVLLGWSALMLLPGMIGTNFPLAIWILAGGVLYTLGIIPFLMHSRASHFIWHFFVLAGAVTQWIGIYLYLFK